MRKLLGLLILVVGIALVMLSACSSDDGPVRVCEPGDQKTCACPGGASGAQVCADDGAKWGACMGCDTVDGDTDTDAVVTDGDDDIVADGDDTLDADPEPEPDPDSIEEAEPEPEPEPEVEPEPESEPVPQGTCAFTGEVCTTQDDCPQDTLQGFIITRDDYPSEACAFEARFETAITNTCEGRTYYGCETEYDCPDGMHCGSYASNWCEGNNAYGTCSCSNCDPCQLSTPNVCVICGNGTLDSDLEECEDGNARSGDGCSEVCRFEGRCWNAMDTDINVRCATDSDCDVSQCNASPCECRLPQ